LASGRCASCRGCGTCRPATAAITRCRPSAFGVNQPRPNFVTERDSRQPGRNATERRIRAADGWVSGVRGSAQIGWLWACTSQGR
jgi:hypothetical protein